MVLKKKFLFIQNLSKRINKEVSTKYNWIYSQQQLNSLLTWFLCWFFPIPKQTYTMIKPSQNGISASKSLDKVEKLSIENNFLSGSKIFPVSSKSNIITLNRELIRKTRYIKSPKICIIWSLVEFE